MKMYMKHLVENIGTIGTSSVSSNNSSVGNNNKGGVTVKKQDADVNKIKQYTDKGINVNVIEEGEESNDEENKEVLDKYFKKKVKE